MANPSAYALNTENSEAQKEQAADTGKNTEENIGSDDSSLQQYEIKAAANGEVIPVSDVPDEVFAGGALGEGVAVIVTDGKVYAPVDGEISMIADTLHAFGISTEDGLELLVHIGINTVELEGKGFTAKVQEGDKVRAGQLLCEVDMKLMKAKGYKMHTPMLMTNADECRDIQLIPDKFAKAGKTTVITYRK